MDPKTVNLVVYHGACSDGFGAAWAAWKLLGSRAEYCAAEHGQPPPDVAGKRVIILDFAYDKKTTRRMMKEADDFEMRDHHKSAMMMLDGLAGIKTDFFDLTKSGCVLAWEYFHPGVEVPKFLQYIQNRDLGWKPYMEYAREFSMAFDMTPFEFKAYDQMLNASYVDDCIRRGAHILPYAETVIDKACAKAVRRKLRGHNVLVTNATHWISEIGMKLAPDCEFAMVWHWDHHAGQARVSLRSFHPDVDCGTIAKRFGGGGHAEIAGFEYEGSIEDLFGGNGKAVKAAEKEKDTKPESEVPAKVSSDLGRDVDEDGTRVGEEIDRSEDEGGMPGGEQEEHEGAGPRIQRKRKGSAKPRGKKRTRENGTDTR